MEYKSKEYLNALDDVIDFKLGKVLYAVVWVGKKCGGDVDNRFSSDENVIGLFTSIAAAKTHAAKFGYVDSDYSKSDVFNQYVEIIEFKFSKVLNKK
jgi:hypothetical protein